ncbi:hypothetical protein EJ110_NYTH46886 [Nymphaea thermarum]|nr:hypothetical protein EJ110_NYTH46886 [Nymphaea thermarum]
MAETSLSCIVDDAMPHWVPWVTTVPQAGPWAASAMADAPRRVTMAEEKNENENICAIDIQRKYESYDPSEHESKLELERKCIYRWPNDLVFTSSLSKHRTPHMASFGPYYHGEEHLKRMEHHKEKALYRILKKSKVSTSVFIESLKGVEQELRDSYDNLD